MKFDTVILISLAALATSQNANTITESQAEIVVKKQLDSRSFGLKDFLSDHMPWSGKKNWKDHEGKQHWNDNDGKEHWKDRDGNDCWNDKDGKKHWKDHEGKEHWKDQDGKEHFYKPPFAMKRSNFQI